MTLLIAAKHTEGILLASDSGMTINDETRMVLPQHKFVQAGAFWVGAAGADSHIARFNHAFLNQQPGDLFVLQDLVLKLGDEYGKKGLLELDLLVADSHDMWCLGGSGSILGPFPEYLCVGSGEPMATVAMRILYRRARKRTSGTVRSIMLETFREVERVSLLVYRPFPFVEQ